MSICNAFRDVINTIDVHLRVPSTFKDLKQSLEFTYGGEKEILRYFKSLANFRSGNKKETMELKPIVLDCWMEIHLL